MSKHTVVPDGKQMTSKYGAHKNIIFIAFPRQQRFANASQCYVTCTLPVLFYFTLRPFFFLVTEMIGLHKISLQKFRTLKIRQG